MLRMNHFTGKMEEDGKDAIEVRPIATIPAPPVTLVDMIGEVSESQTEVVQEVITSPNLVGQEIKDLVSHSVDEASTKWTNIQVDSQVLSLFMSCPRKYDYVYRRHLNPIEGNSKGIVRGSLIHDALLKYWQERIKSDGYNTAIQVCIKTAKDKLNQELKFEQEEKLEILGTLLEFLKFIQASPWIPLEAEKYFRVKIYEDAGLKLRIYLTGRIDLIMRSPQIPVVPIDVKTESERWFHSQMKNQFKIYCIALGVNILGVQRVGFQKTLEVKDKFKLELLPFDQDILDEFTKETLPYWVKQMIVAHEDNHFPMNTSSCIHGHFKCQFSDAYNQGICNVSRTVREQKIERYFKIGEPWDPANVET